MSVRYLGEDYSVFSSFVQPEDEQAEKISNLKKDGLTVFLYPSLNCDIALKCYASGKMCDVLPYGVPASVAAYMTQYRGMPLSSLTIEMNGISFLYDGIDLKDGTFMSNSEKCKQILSNKRIFVRNCEVDVTAVECEELYAVIKTDDMLSFDIDVLSALSAELDLGASVTCAVDINNCKAVAHSVSKRKINCTNLLASVALSTFTRDMYGKDIPFCLGAEAVFCNFNGKRAFVKARAELSVNYLPDGFGYCSLV